MTNINERVSSEKYINQFFKRMLEFVISIFSYLVNFFDEYIVVLPLLSFLLAILFLLFSIYSWIKTGHWELVSVKKTIMYIDFNINSYFHTTFLNVIWIKKALNEFASFSMVHVCLLLGGLLFLSRLVLIYCFAFFIMIFQFILKKIDKNENHLNVKFGSTKKFEAIEEFEKQYKEDWEEREKSKRPIKILEILPFVTIFLIILISAALDSPKQIPLIIFIGICLLILFSKFKKLLNIFQAYLIAQSKLNNVTLHHLKDSIDYIKELIPYNSDCEINIKKYYKYCFRDENKKITRLENYFWWLYIKTQEYYFERVLRSILSGKKVHMIFKETEDYKVLAINCGESSYDNILISEIIDQDENYYSNIFPTFKPYPALKVYEIGRHTFLHYEGLSEHILHILEDENYPNNVTYEVIENRV